MKKLILILLSIIVTSCDNSNNQSEKKEIDYRYAYTIDNQYGRSELMQKPSSNSTKILNLKHNDTVYFISDTSKTKEIKAISNELFLDFLQQANPLWEIDDIFLVGTGFQGGSVIAQFLADDKQKIEKYFLTPEIKKILPTDIGKYDFVFTEPDYSGIFDVVVGNWVKVKLENKKNIEGYVFDAFLKKLEEEIDYCESQIKNGNKREYSGVEIIIDDKIITNEGLPSGYSCDLNNPNLSIEDKVVLIAKNFTDENLTYFSKDKMNGSTTDIAEWFTPKDNRKSFMPDDYGYAFYFTSYREDGTYEFLEGDVEIFYSTQLNRFTIETKIHLNNNGTVLSTYYALFKGSKIIQLKYKY